MRREERERMKLETTSTTRLDREFLFQESVSERTSSIISKERKKRASVIIDPVADNPFRFSRQNEIV